MSAKYRSPAQRTVRTPEARQALDQWIATLEPGVQERGRRYYEEGRVLAAWAPADHYLEAEVQGQERYGVTLFLTRGNWSSSCTCPVDTNCKHAVATALAWIAKEGADFDTEAVALETDGKPGAPAGNAAVVPFAAPAAPPPIKKASFRQQWEPVLAEKLGRELTDEERSVVGELGAIYTEFVQARCVLWPRTLIQHGFAAAVPPAAQPYEPLFRDWWPPHNPPGDAWALWQYLAVSLELRGAPIPEVLRPLTDTSMVRAALDAQFANQQLEQWRRAFADSAPLSGPPRRPRLSDGVTNVRARLRADGGMSLETRADATKPWKPASRPWVQALDQARPADFEAFAPAEAALAVAVAIAQRQSFDRRFTRELPTDVVSAVLATRAAHPAIALPDGSPLRIESEPLAAEALLSAEANNRLQVRLITPDGNDASGAVLVVEEPEPLYLHQGRLWRGPPPLPDAPLPISALSDASLMSGLRRAGLRLPRSMELKRKVVALRPVLKLWLTDPETDFLPGHLCAQLTARSEDPACEQQWAGIGGWQWTKGGAPAPRRPDGPLLEFDLTAAQAVSARMAEFRFFWNDWVQAWARYASATLPDEIVAWHATLPDGLDIDASPEIAAFFRPAPRASLDFSARPADSSHDWFDVTVALRVEDTKLAADEIALLMKARGKWVRLPKHGWRRLDVSGLTGGEDISATLDRLGLTAQDVLASGHASSHRVHALQLATEASAVESRDAKLAAVLRRRAADLVARPSPELPPGLSATLRPYQREGFQFLAHLSANGFGGVLADDMGLGKTVQSLAWLLHLAAAPRPKKKPFRALVVCPKSVMHGWLGETARFAPGLKAATFAPARNAAVPARPAVQLLIANYTQLRQHAKWFATESWDAVILDEGQFIKNPGSQVAHAARALPTRHRLVLTGTPVENRLTDLWSLFAFAQPGLLGTPAAFRRQYDDKDPEALARLHRRVRHFLLRRTKAQAAPDLPPRTEDDLPVELEPAQRKLYDAELKRARQQLLGIESDRALDKVRFNVLASLLRLRQICCHPALVDRAHASLPSAKLEALLERLEELRDEGHQVLVFSQFVEMLEIIRKRLVDAGIGHLILTGATENRAALVETFQSDRTKTVFLLSLKAAGFGLNLTAASYAVLYDPWWNPAVEAQAIDRTHRIGQTRPVIAYRLLARGTVEEKIRALQQEKAVLASAVVQEESLARVLDLESLRRVLA